MLGCTIYRKGLSLSMEDYIVRATAGDAQIRAFAATTRVTVETARTLHDLSPVASARLGKAFNREEP